MEIIKDNENPGRTGNGRQPGDPTRVRSLYTGLVLVAAGGIWMMKNLHLIPYSLFTYIFSWQVLLMVFGGFLMLSRKYTAGTVAIAAGLVFAFTEWWGWYLPLRDVFLPGLIIAVGIGVLIHNIRK